MEHNFSNGADFWRDTAANQGLDMASAICGNYLNTQLKQVLSPEERQFCGELFTAMCEATAGNANPAKLIYPYSLEEAAKRMESFYFHANSDRNDDCAHAIDAAINGSCYELYHYNLDIAAMTAIHQYGFQRVNEVLAFCFQTHEWDGRYSTANKQWALGFDLPEKAFSQAYLQAHPVLVEDFTNQARRLYDELSAERFALPGQPESGEVVEGYEITRTITFNNNSGFAIAAHPTAGYVCWQFKTDGGKRDYFWGHYCNDEKDTANNYIARIAVHMSGDERGEPQRKPKDRGAR